MPKTFATATVVKNAGYKLAEWIAFQKVIGFDAVLLLDNGSTDETVNIARSFENHFDVRVEPWNETSSLYQVRGYDYLLGTMAQEFDWCACIDADEFLVLQDGKTVADLVDVADHVSAISMPWAFFGSNGHDASPDSLVIEAYTRRATEDFGPNQQMKSIIRPDKFVKCENVHVFQMPGRYKDISGVEYDGGSHLLPFVPNYSFGKLHHYFVQSKQDWSEKLARGYHDTTRSAADFDGYDRNEIVDESATKYAESVHAVLYDVFGDLRPRRSV